MGFVVVDELLCCRISWWATTGNRKRQEFTRDNTLTGFTCRNWFDCACHWERILSSLRLPEGLQIYVGWGTLNGGVDADLTVAGVLANEVASSSPDVVFFCPLLDTERFFLACSLSHVSPRALAKWSSTESRAKTRIRKKLKGEPQGIDHLAFDIRNRWNVSFETWELES